MNTNISIIDWLAAMDAAKAGNIFELVKIATAATNDNDTAIWLMGAAITSA